jgi:co-chaperonin GroES (HSP10)
MSINFIPSIGKTLLLLDKEEEIRKSAGGIIIPHKENLDPSVIEPKKATVVAQCSHRLENGIEIKPEFNIGDRVLINSAIGSNGLRILIDNVVYNLIGEVNILGKFDEKV